MRIFYEVVRGLIHYFIQRFEFGHFDYFSVIFRIFLSFGMWFFKPFEFCIFILSIFTIWHLKRRNRKRYSGLQIDPKLYLEYFNKDISRNRMFWIRTSDKTKLTHRCHLNDALMLGTPFVRSTRQSTKSSLRGVKE